MEKFEKLKSVAAPMGIPNVDTDAIIPKQFLKTIKRAGLGKALFFERRYNENDEERSDFVLNQDKYRKAEILIAGDNFGCGSSREHAPWALLDYGIRCVIATSFADIFYNNSFKNGVIPIILPQEEVDLLMKEAETAYGEALAGYRKLAESNPEAYLPHVALTLNNLAYLYFVTEQREDAGAACAESGTILEPFWKQYPEVHDDQWNKILAVKKLLGE